MERIFPFAKRDGIKKGALQNINLQYNLNGRYGVRTTTDEFLTAEMFQNGRLGAEHSIPIATNFKVAKYLSVTMGGTYRDVWTWETYPQRYDPELERVVTDTIGGFDRFNEYSLNAGIGTTVYGTFDRGEDKKIQALRHILRPSVTYGYAPSFDQYYDEVVNETTGDIISYTRFQNTPYGTPRQRRSSAMNFSLANSLEAKVRDKDTLATEPKKIFLLNSFNLNTSYNLEADSLNLSPINLTGGTTLLDNKMNINFGASLDPYAVDNVGRRINTFNIDAGGGLFRVTSARANIGYSLSSKDFQKDQSGEEPDEDPYSGNAYVANSGGRTDNLFGEANNFNRSAFEGRDPDAVENPPYGNKVTWDVRMQYAVTYSNNNRQGDITNHSLMFSGNVNLTPRWLVGVSSGYDFVNKGFTLTQFRFERDLNSFHLKFDWTPFGEFERWYFFIGIKANLLRDLKWENRSQPGNIR
jgi:hypothetical protein